MLRLNRPLLVAGLTASLLATAAILPASAQGGPPPNYATQANAPLDVNVFYDQLGQYGTWVEHPDYQFVFIPTNVGPDWRPYQEGRWVWTDQYGWYWESYEPFGWATYHYGRWGYDPSYGWFWVPGDTWAPAWVTWRKGGGRTGWSPIAPDRPGYAVGRPNYYAPPVAESWVFVEDRYMGEEDLAVYVAPIPQTNVFLADAPDYYEPSWNDGYYVNRGFGYDVYDRPVRDRVYTRDVVYVDNRDDVFYGNGQLGIFAPAIAMAAMGGGRGYAPPPRYERRIDPGQRAMIRQYVNDDRDTRGAFAPSAALLNVLEPNQRRDLRQTRFNQPDNYRQQMQQLEQQRADRLNEMRRDAMARNAQIAQQRQQLNDQRRAQADRIRDQYRERAQRMQGRPDMQPGYRPAVAPGGNPNAQGAAQQQMLERQRAQQEQFRNQQQRQQQADQMRQQAGEAQRRAAEQQQQRVQQQQQIQQQRAQQAQQLRAQQQQQAVEAQRRAAEQQQQRLQQQQRVQQERAQQQQQMRAQQQQQVQQQRAAQQERMQQQQQMRAQQQQQIQQQRAAQQQQRAQQIQQGQQQRAAQQQQQQQRIQQMQQMRAQQQQQQRQLPPQQQPRRPGAPDPTQLPPPQ